MIDKFICNWCKKQKLFSEGGYIVYGPDLGYAYGKIPAKDPHLYKCPDCIEKEKGQLMIRPSLMCLKCGKTNIENKSKYCGNGSDKDNDHQWIRMKQESKYE